MGLVDTVMRTMNVMYSMFVAISSVCGNDVFEASIVLFKLLYVLLFVLLDSFLDFFFTFYNGKCL